ncbi:MAG: LCP family protein [Faecalibacterium sp.]|nr:LCP family protein [Ruminococcus sp.]MCM1392415.1 LCP family protein [Ruminococcus sp.]MCM1486403.1 LCP family protein [Faecalibacterium sp.]
MKIPFIEELGIPAKADPKKVRREQLRKKKFALKPFIVAFAVIIVLLAAVSIMTIVKESTKDNSNTTDISSEELLLDISTDALSTNENQQYINKNILLMLTKDDSKGLHLLAILNLDSFSDNISLTYVPITAQCLVNNNNCDMTEHLTNGGIKELLWAVREYTQMNIDNYISCDEKDFTDIIKSIGEFKLNIEKKIDDTYNGVNFTIEEGEQSFTADSLLKYFLYLCQTATDENEKLTQIISDIAQKVLIDNDTNVTEDFNLLVSHIDTDISAMDIAKYSVALEQLVEAGNFSRIVVKK